MELGFPELLIIGVIVLLIFGPGRLDKTLGELGARLRSLKENFRTDKKDEKAATSRGEDGDRPA